MNNAQEKNKLWDDVGDKHHEQMSVFTDYGKLSWAHSLTVSSRSAAFLRR